MLFELLLVEWYYVDMFNMCMQQMEIWNVAFFCIYVYDLIL